MNSEEAENSKLGRMKLFPEFFSLIDAVFPYIRAFIKVAQTEKLMILFFFFFELTVVLCTLIFTSSLVGYLGAGAPFSIFVIPETQENLLFLGLIASLGILFAKFAQGFIEAKLVSDRELRYAKHLRALFENDYVKTISNRDLSRISHYYGRLCRAIMNAVAGAGILFLVLTAVLCLADSDRIVWIVIASVILFFIISLFCVFLARNLKNASVNLIGDARNVALWKMDASIETDEHVFGYFRNYFQRVFLVGILGHMSTILAFCFIFVLLANHYFKWFEVELEDVFSIYIIANLYFGSLIRFFTNVLQTAAFFPFVLEVILKTNFSLRKYR